MEKLVKLLQKYEKSLNKKSTHKRYYENNILFCENISSDYGMVLSDDEAESLIISRLYGFIDRLIANDYIDFNNEKYAEHYGEIFGNDNSLRSTTKSVIAILSINLWPFEFLLSILK